MMEHRELPAALTILVLNNDKVMFSDADSARVLAVLSFSGAPYQGVHLLECSRAPNVPTLNPVLVQWENYRGSVIAHCVRAVAWVLEPLESDYPIQCIDSRRLVSK